MLRDQLGEEGAGGGEGERDGGGGEVAVGGEVGDEEVVGGEVRGGADEVPFVVRGEGAVEEEQRAWGGGVDGLEVEDGGRHGDLEGRGSAVGEFGIRQSVGLGIK